jgi:hypothetical protein
MSGMSGDEMIDENEKYDSSNCEDELYSNTNEELLSLRPQVFFFFPSPPNYFFQSSIIFLTTKDIFPRIEKKVKSVQELLFCSYDEALIILHCFKWSSEKIETLYLDNPEKYQLESGLKLPHGFPIAPSTKNALCPICLDLNTANCLTSTLECNHKLCPKCWGDYINFLVKFLKNFKSTFSLDFRFQHFCILEVSLR